MKEEVDEANGEDKDKTESESKDTPASKGALRISRNNFFILSFLHADRTTCSDLSLKCCRGLSYHFCSAVHYRDVREYVCAVEKKRKLPEHNVLFVLCSLIRMRTFPPHFGTPLYPQLIRWST